MTSIIVCDVETVPDIEGFARANRLDGKTDEEVREAIGDKFPKHVYHSIICIGALIASDQGSHWEVDALGAPHVGDRTEKELITAFVNKIDELKPQLVTFNGSGFDLPVLRYRAMVNEVSAPGLSARSYFNRYTEDALDLCDVLASFNPQCRASLDEICKLMGIPGKPDGFCGSDVESYFREGKIQEIAVLGAPGFGPRRAATQSCDGGLDLAPIPSAERSPTSYNRSVDLFERFPAIHAALSVDNLGKQFAHHRFPSA